ncbi:MAG: integrase arm-type DNA-binding domain-containing protein [Rhodospirillales bacterium]
MAHQLNRLSARKVESIKEPGRYADGGGLWLQVTPRQGGDGVTKSWLFRYTSPKSGKPRQYGLGSLNAVSLADAREVAQQTRILVKSGIDPVDQRKAQKAEAKAKADRSETFRDFAEEYIRLKGDGWKNAKHRQQWSNTLESYVYPVIGGLHVGDVTKQHVLAILNPIWTEKAETARRVRSRIETVLDMAIAADAREGDNPARLGVLKFLLPSQGKRSQVRHHPAMPYVEIGAFMSELRKRDDLSARALEFLILTGCRTSEVISARWDEIDGDVWTIPPSRMKAGREHRVPLSSDALAVLKALPVVDKNPHIFPGQRAKRPLSNMAMLKLMDRMGFGHYTAHGFRSSFRDWSAETTAFPREVAEAALAHGNPDKVEAAYQRGDFFDKRRKLMDAWAAYCAKVPKSGSNVTPIRKAEAS